MPDTPDAEIVRRKVQNSIQRLFARDSYLMINNVNERSITHKWACYLQEEFPDWHVDCEYNRNHELPKRILSGNAPHVGDDTEGRTVFPDVIVHVRGTDTNLLVIEVKKSTSQESDEIDLEKLEAFRQELNYLYTLFVKFEMNCNPPEIAELRWSM